ncbi:radical SAM protein [Chloroflexota bacterium]
MRTDVAPVFGPSPAHRQKISWKQRARTQALIESEQGGIEKDWGGRLPVALLFPNAYHLGMSSLAIQTLYGLWNGRDDVVCERVFYQQGVPHSVESGAPLDYFPVIAISLAYEMDYFNVVDLLTAASIPPRSKDRDESYPLILAGGPAVSANPAPLAAIMDAFVIGEVEPILHSLTDALHLTADDRDTALAALAELPGLYVPSIHGVDPVATDSEKSVKITRQWLRDLDRWPTHSLILTPNTEFANVGLVEIARGCGRGCRFCLAGYAFRPPRHRSLDALLPQARHLLERTERLGLVSAAVSDHPDIDRLAIELRGLGARLTVSSMRVDPLSETLVRSLAQSGTRTLTIAPEAGSERLRKVINKTQTEDDVLRAVDMAARHGIAHIKMYFMLGLPTEEPADVQALVDLTLACSERFPRQITVNVTPFVPKAHTPFQRSAQTPASIVSQHIALVKKGLLQRGIGVKSESPSQAEIQGSLARGDYRLAEAIIATKRVKPRSWRQAVESSELSTEELLGRRPAGEPLPWSFVQSGVRRTYLTREARRATAARLSHPCPPTDCDSCGVSSPSATGFG